MVLWAKTGLKLSGGVTVALVTYGHFALSNGVGIVIPGPMSAQVFVLSAPLHGYRLKGTSESSRIAGPVCSSARSHASVLLGQEIVEAGEYDRQSIRVEIHIC